MQINSEFGVSHGKPGGAKYMLFLTEVEDIPQLGYLPPNIIFVFYELCTQRGCKYSRLDGG